MRTLLFALACLLSTTAFAQSTATYRVTFESTWSEDTHPVQYPGSSAHYSPLVGAVHATPGAIWTAGGIASDGVEQMAETGGTSILRNEVAGMISSGEAKSDLVGPALGTTPNSTSMTIVLDEQHPLVSLVTMIAPSPDWFVGVDGLDLREAEGWVPGITVQLLAWDAGTDSGTAYTSPNLDTTPRQPIALSSAAPFATGVPLGAFVFERLSVVSADAEPEAFSLGAVAPNPTRGDAALTMSLRSASDVSLRVFDMMGREVASRDASLAAGAQRLDLPTADLPAGSYIVRVRTADGVATRRVAIVR